MRVLIIDDEEKMAAIVARRLEREGFETKAQASPEKALAELEAFAPDVILTDLKMPGLSGLDVLERAKRALPNVEVVLMTAHGTVQTAVEALQKGARDYLTKPFQMDELLVVLARLRERADLKRENAMLKEALAERARFENVVAVSGEMQAALERARRVAASEAPVLLLGETGTGKEVIASAIHAASRRANGPLVKVNCGALAETLLESELFGHVKGAFTGADRDRAGFFEVARGGTLFLDEIGEISSGLQVRLLRVLQDGAFTRVGSSEPLTTDARVIAATNRDLEAAVEASEFREDLYYRLNVVPIRLPPLRDRPEDVAPLAEFFLGRARVEAAARRRRFSAEALDALKRYQWPGNARELQNAVECAAVMARGPEIVLEDLPDAIVSAAARKSGGMGAIRAAIDGIRLEDLEKLAIRHALEEEGWNHTRAAKRLGVTRRALAYRMQKHDFPAKPGAPRPSDLNEPNLADAAAGNDSDEISTRPIGMSTTAMMLLVNRDRDDPEEDESE